MLHLVQVLPYLSDAKQKKFFQKIYEYGADLNCHKTIQAFAIAYDLREEQYSRSFYLLNKMNIKFHNHKCLPGDLQRFVNSLAAYSPSEQWLYIFCEKNDIILKNQETLEALRRACGKKSIINSFCIKHYRTLQRDPRLIWNVDETSTASNKNKKFYAKKKCFPCPK